MLHKPNLRRTINYQRVLPALCHIVMVGYVCAALLGYRSFIPELFVVCVGFFLVHKFSVALGFCFKHRITIYYPYFVFVCIWAERYIGFGKYLSTAQAIVLVLGIVSLIYVLLPPHCCPCNNQPPTSTNMANG